MERVIKFRGWSEELNRWVYGGYFYDLVAPRILEDIWFDEEHGFNAICVVPESVGMFTDVIGEDGVEIYEGDILVTNNGSISEVRFGKFDYEYQNYEGVFEDISGIGFSFSDGEPFDEGVKPYRVIGNKFEGKKL